MADTRQQAVATADAYQQGNIATLDHATTRRLIALTVMSEGHGGDFAATNRLGFVGRYKADSEFLAEAGYVDKDKLGQAMAGHKSEWAWAKSGGMTAFMEDASNWNKGLSLDAYKQSPELQDKAFKLNAEQDHRRGLEQGFLGDDQKPGRVAGFLKTAHIVDFNGAREAMTGGRAYRDANGVSNYDRIHDISRNGDGLDKRMTAVRLDPSETPVGKTVTPSASVVQADHPEHGRYREMYAMLGAVSGLASDQERQQAAASMMVAIKASKECTASTTSSRGLTAWCSRYRAISANSRTRFCRSILPDWLHSRPRNRPPNSARLRRNPIRLPKRSARNVRGWSDCHHAIALCDVVP